MEHRVTGSSLCLLFKNIMLNKNWKFILECASQRKKGKQKSTIISIARNSYYYHFSLHTLSRILFFLVLFLTDTAIKFMYTVVYISFYFDSITYI